MAARRRWILVGLALLVGILAGVALGLVDGDGSPLSAARAGEIRVRVENEGHDAVVSLTMQPVRGAAPVEWGWTIPSGEFAEARNPNPAGETSVRVVVAWSGGGRSARGEGTFLVDPADCRGGGSLLVIAADTSNGVALTPSQKRCI